MRVSPTTRRAPGSPARLMLARWGESPLHQEQFSPNLGMHLSGLERSNKNKGEPDHAASPGVPGAPDVGAVGWEPAASGASRSLLKQRTWAVWSEATKINDQLKLSDARAW